MVELSVDVQLDEYAIEMELNPAPPASPSPTEGRPANGGF